MFSPALLALAQKVVSVYTTEKRKIVTAESCTGGLIAGALTSISGASAVLERGFVTYSNEAKMEMLGVDTLALNQCGAVSAQVATQMAQGALKFSPADVAISVTGIAGPDGGSAEKIVGLVYFGLATRDGVAMHYRCQFSGDRDSIRTQAVTEALKLLLTVSEHED